MPAATNVIEIVSNGHNYFIELNKVEKEYLLNNSWAWEKSRNNHTCKHHKSKEIIFNSCLLNQTSGSAKEPKNVKDCV